LIIPKYWIKIQFSQQAIAPQMKKEPPSRHKALGEALCILRGLDSTLTHTACAKQRYQRSQAD
jgi:hypothetical protein